MKKTIKKTLPLLLTAVLVATGTPVTIVHAADDAEVMVEEEIVNDGDVLANWYEDYEYELSGAEIRLHASKGTITTSSISIPATVTIGEQIYTVVLDKDPESSQSLWFNDKDTITSISFENGVKVSENGSYLFSEMHSLETLNLDGLDTSATINMTGMLSNMQSLKKLDVSKLNTAAATDMHYMFRWNYSLEEITFGSSFVTSAVTDMSHMFQFDSKLASLDLSGFDTSSCGEMPGMFNDCESLTSLDLTGFNTTNTWWLSALIKGCKGIISLDLRGFDFTKANTGDGKLDVTDDHYVSEMFVGSGLINLYLPVNAMKYVDFGSESHYVASLKTIYYAGTQEQWDALHNTLPDGITLACDYNGEVQPIPDPEPSDPITDDNTTDPLSGSGEPTDSQPVITNAASQSLTLVKGQKFSLSQKDWISSDKNIVRFSKGNVKAMKAGSVSLTRGNGDEKQTITINVIDFAIGKGDKTVNLTAGDNGVPLKLALLLWEYNEEKDAADQLFAAYQSLAPDVATVNEAGELTAISKGTAVINACVNGVTFKFTVKVADVDTFKPPFGEGEVTIFPEPMQSYQLKAQGFNAKKALYNSDNTKAIPKENLKKDIAYEDDIVRITTAGKLTAIGVGTTTITTSEGGKDFTFSVVVEEPRLKTLHMNIKSSKTLKIYGIKNNLNWKAYDPEDLTKEISTAVSINGSTIKGTAVGNVVLKAEYEGFTYLVDVFVEDPSLKIGGELEGKAASAKWITKPGSSLKIEQLSVYQNVLFMSSKSSVAYADSDGVIHARSTGSAKLKAKVNGKTISIIVSVK